MASGQRTRLSTLPVEVRLEIWKWLARAGGPVTIKTEYKNGRIVFMINDDLKLHLLERAFHKQWITELEHRELIFETLKDAVYFFHQAVPSILTGVRYVTINRACGSAVRGFMAKTRVLQFGLRSLFTALAACPNLKQVTFAVGFCAPNLLPPTRNRTLWASELLDPQRQYLAKRQRCCLYILQKVLLIVKDLVVNIIQANQLSTSYAQSQHLNLLDADPGLQRPRGQAPALDPAISAVILQRFEHYLANPFPTPITSTIVNINQWRLGRGNDLPLTFAQLRSHPLEDTVLTGEGEYYRKPQKYYRPPFAMCRPDPYRRLLSILDKPQLSVWTPQEISDMLHLADKCDRPPEFIFHKVLCGQLIRLLNRATATLKSLTLSGDNQHEQSEQRFFCCVKINNVIKRLQAFDERLDNWDDHCSTTLGGDRQRIMQRYLRCFLELQQQTAPLKECFSAKALLKAWIWTLSPRDFRSNKRYLTVRYEEMTALHPQQQDETKIVLGVPAKMDPHEPVSQLRSTLSEADMPADNRPSAHSIDWYFR